MVKHKGWSTSNHSPEELCFLFGPFMFIFMQILVTDLTLQRQSCSFNCEFKYKKKTVLFLGQKTDATLNSEGN